MFIPGGSENPPHQPTRQAHDRPASSRATKRSNPDATLLVASRMQPFLLHPTDAASPRGNTTPDLRERTATLTPPPAHPFLSLQCQSTIPPATALPGPRASREAAYRPIPRQRQRLFRAARCIGETGIAGASGLTAFPPKSHSLRPERAYRGNDTGGGEGRMQDRKSTRLNSSHIQKSRMPSSA